MVFSVDGPSFLLVFHSCWRYLPFGSPYFWGALELSTGFQIMRTCRSPGLNSSVLSREERGRKPEKMLFSKVNWYVWLTFLAAWV